MHGDFVPCCTAQCMASRRNTLSGNWQKQCFSPIAMDINRCALEHEDRRDLGVWFNLFYFLIQEYENAKLPSWKALLGKKLCVCLLQEILVRDQLGSPDTTRYLCLWMRPCSWGSEVVHSCCGARWAAKSQAPEINFLVS